MMDVQTTMDAMVAQANTIALLTKERELLCAVETTAQQVVAGSQTKEMLERRLVVLSVWRKELK